MPIETTKWDTSEHLDSPEAIAAYIDAAMEDGDPALVSAALGDVARAIGMTQRDGDVERVALSRLERGRPSRVCNRFQGDEGTRSAAVDGGCQLTADENEQKTRNFVRNLLCSQT